MRNVDKYKKIKRLCKFAILIVVSSLSTTFALSATAGPDAYYDWASGYKYRTNPAVPPDGSMDDELQFKLQTIYGGHLQDYVDLKATFPVSKENLLDAFPQCLAGELGSGGCSSEGQTISGAIDFTYTCAGNVSQQLSTSIDANQINGGDTMYGAWSMLFAFLPPAYEDTCTKDGRCFVGNAFIIDTKAQKEANPGVYQGLGVKELVNGPGEVFYFDQVRALTQPPAYTRAKMNNPFIVGAPPLNLNLCNGKLFEQEMGSRTVSGEAEAAFAPTLSKLQGEWAEDIDAYAAAEKATGIPCEILAGIHWNENGNDPTKSLWQQGPFLGGSLKADAIMTANKIKEIMDTSLHYGPFPHTFEGYTAGVTLHNGPGNLNCKPDYDGCYGPKGSPVPTEWQLSGKCPASFLYEDSPYALAWLDDKYMNLDLIYAHDANPSDPCSSYFIPPKRRGGPGAITVAYIVHEFAAQ